MVIQSALFKGRRVAMGCSFDW